MFLSTLHQNTTPLTALHEQPDFTVQKLEAGRSVNIPVSLIDTFSDIKGVSYVAPRVFGRYFTPDTKHYFTIIGVDFFDEQLVKWIARLYKDIDVKAFLQKDQMIVGNAVMKYMKAHYYDTYFNFTTPKGKEKKVYLYKILPENSNLISSDFILMDINLAREILGVAPDKATDIILNVPNPAEKGQCQIQTPLPEL